MSRLRLALLALAAGLALALPAAAQKKVPAHEPKSHAYEPQVGQPGKDVIWVPTPDEMVERMLTMAQVTPQDLVYDLGAGDGKIAIAAAKKFGARAIGIEYNPDMVRLAQHNAELAGVAGRAKIVQGDIFATDFTQATVVTLYLLPVLNLKLRPLLLAMRPGTRVVSHAFAMEDWEPDEVSQIDGRRAYFWLVPASVLGTWTLQAGGERNEMALEQKFQRISGSIEMVEDKHAGLRDPRLHGAEISFSYIDRAGARRDFRGRVSGLHMEGTYRINGGAERRWTATKR